MSQEIDLLIENKMKEDMITEKTDISKAFTEWFYLQEDVNAKKI